MPPGKRAAGIAGTWQRDLETDLRRLRDLAATVLACLLPDAELAILGIGDLPERALALGFSVRRFPFSDGGIPANDAQFEGFLESLADDVLLGERVVVHCRGGLGRAGLTASCLLLRLGDAATASDAIAKVRAARSARAVETKAQEEFVEQYAVRLSERRG